MASFVLKDEIQRYVNRVTSEIRSKKKRQQVKQELFEHIEDTVCAKMLSGLSEQEAFLSACEALGDVYKLQTLFSAVHNRDRMPSVLKYLLFSLAASALIASYFLIDNRTYRSWFLLFAQIGLLIMAAICVYSLWRLLASLVTRYKSLQKLKKYAGANGLSLCKVCNPYRSVFSKSKVPELILETPATRYHLLLWATVFKRKQLNLLDNGLYSYSSFVGYSMLYTRAYSFFPNVGYLLRHEYFPTIHSSLVEVPKGMHLMPKIEWETNLHPSKENQYILLLNPAPFKVVGLTEGQQHTLTDGCVFDNYTVYSMNGFLSFLNGERIATRGTYVKKKQAE